MYKNYILNKKPDEVIYPLTDYNFFGITKEQSITILFDLYKQNKLEIYFLTYCNKCKVTGNVCDRLFDIPDIFTCTCCNTEYNSYENSKVIFKTKGSIKNEL